MSNKQAVHTDNPGSGTFTKVASGPVPEIEDGQILIKAVAYAANPTDWKHAIMKWGSPGSVAGSDASGTVVQVGKNVTGYEVGDVVSAYVHGNISPSRGAFSQYVAADVVTTLKYDNKLIGSAALSVGTTPSGPINTFEAAASATSSLITAALTFTAAFKASYSKTENSGKYVLIWGGATATGVAAIQVAKLIFGFDVIVTASKKNHAFLKSLGANEVFDYHDSDVVESIKKVANGNIVFAYDTVSTNETFQQTYDATEGSNHHIVLDNLLYLDKDTIKTDDSRNVTFTRTLCAPDGKSINLGGVSFTMDETLRGYFNHFWQQVLPGYLTQLKTSNLKVLKPGLESANDALTLLYENNVSAEKVVFRGK